MYLRFRWYSPVFYVSFTHTHTHTHTHTRTHLSHLVMHSCFTQLSKHASPCRTIIFNLSHSYMYTSSSILFFTQSMHLAHSLYICIARRIYCREREAEDSFILIHPRRREEVQEEKESGKRGNEDDATYSRYTHIRYGECSKWRTCCGLPLCADGDGCDTERHADAHGRSRHDDILCRQTCARRGTHIDGRLPYSL